MTTETQTPEALKNFPNRRAVEREIESLKNPVGMQLNDGKERVRLPGGTLERMLAVIDRLAALASAQAQQALTDLECPPDPEWVDRQMQSEHAGLVPVEPNEGMAYAGLSWCTFPERVYRAMLNAAPPAPAAENPTTSDSPEYTAGWKAGYKHGAWGGAPQPAERKPQAIEMVAVPLEDLRRLVALTNFNSSALAASVAAMASGWLAGNAADAKEGE